MISLFSRDEYAVLGLATLLDIERIPYRRIGCVAEHDQALLVAAGADFDAAECAAIAAQPALVFHGGPAFATQVLGATGSARAGALRVALDEPIWPNAVTALAARFGLDALRMPGAPFCRVAEAPRGALLARMQYDATSSPAVAQRGACVWSAFDLGTAAADLLTEGYAGGARRPRAARVQAALHGIAETAYYAAPARLRRRLQIASYRARDRRRRDLGEAASEYPIDATGWLLLELLRALIRTAAGPVVRIARWPAGYTSAALLTHDIEPRRYAYGDGLDSLLASSADGQPHAFGIVAEAAARYLESGHCAALGEHEVYCHGLDHRGEPVWGRARVARTLHAARASVEALLGRAVQGYRSPRLDRSPDLTWALDDAGFAYDSSYPDVDRENLRHFGRGVRLNLPYRPLLRDGTAWRSSRCLELPLTAPDCIQPLFSGADVAQLRAAVARKAEFVRASGGLYVALVHGGVFGADDSARRAAHLQFVSAQLRHPETWCTTPLQLVSWWQGREQLRIRCGGATISVANDGSDTVSSAVLVVEQAGGSAAFALPPLQPGQVVGLGSGAARAALENGAHAA